MKKFVVDKSTLGAWIINIGVLIVCLFELIAVWPGRTSSQLWSSQAFYLSIISIIANIYLMHKKRVRLIEYQFVVMALLYLFMYGRIWLSYLQLDSNIHWVLHKFFMAEDMRKTSMYVVSSAQMLFLGMMATYEKNELNAGVVEANNQQPNLYNAGLFLLLIGIPCRIYTDIQSVIATSATGSFTSISASTGLIDDLAYLLIPGLLCIMESKPHIRKLVMYIVTTYFVIIMAVTGDRRFYVSAILTLFAYIRFRGVTIGKKLKLYQWILLILVGCFFLNFLEVIRKMRSGGLGSILSFVTNYGVDVFVLDDLIIDVLVEFGISFFSVVVVTTGVPDIFPFQYGMTFIKTIPSVLPLGFAFNQMFKEASPSVILNSTTKYPVGATIIGDAYANFSVFGIAFIFLFGLLLGKIFNINKASISKKYCVHYFTNYYILINIVRCSFFETFRPIIWCYIFVNVFIGMTNRTKS